MGNGWLRNPLLSCVVTRSTHLFLKPAAPVQKGLVGDMIISKVHFVPMMVDGFHIPPPVVLGLVNSVSIFCIVLSVYFDQASEISPRIHHLVTRFVCGLSGGERETVGLLGRAVDQIYFDVFVEEEEQNENPNENEDDAMTGDEKDGDDGSRRRRQVKRLVDRLHVKYGHPSNPVLARTLRLGGAIPEVVDAAKRVSCPVCDRNQPPKQPPRTTVKRAQEFNEILGLDVFFIRDKADYQHLILSMVDQASTYHVMKVIPGKNSETVAAGMMELWVGVFGAPETLQVDQGKEFVGEFAVASEC